LGVDFKRLSVPTEADHIKGVRAPGRYDATVGSEAEARRIVRGAMPDAVEVPPAVAGQLYPCLTLVSIGGIRSTLQNLRSVTTFHISSIRTGRAARRKPAGAGDTSSSHSRNLEAQCSCGRPIRMSFMFEVYYKAPVDLKREEEITGVVKRLGGTLDCREAPNGTSSDAVCLTYEFRELESAQEAAASLRQRGDHVEGPVTCGS
jgi:hypothetical protein